MALVELRVRGLAVLRSVRLEPGSGLTALTGETGAGKSMCVAALRALLGGRVEPAAIRGDCDGISVAAVFDAVPASVDERLDSLGIPEEELLTLARDVPRSGRPTCRVNGSLVSLAALREIADGLVEITGQGESHRLIRPAYQRGILDALGCRSAAEARADVSAAVRAWRSAEERLRRRRESDARLEERLDDARAVVEELGALHLEAGEDAELAAERRRLVHSARLEAAARSMHQAAAGTDDSPGAADLIVRALRTARDLEGLDPALDAVGAEAGRLADLLRELGASARACADLHVDVTARLFAVEERLAVLDRVRRRHGGSIDAALEALAAARLTLDGARTAGDDAEAEAARCRVVATRAVARLSEVRRRSASRLEREVTSRLRALRLPQARFRVVVGSSPDATGLDTGHGPVAVSVDGADDIEFRLSTTGDGIPLPLGQGPSGGELSRLAMALGTVVGVVDDCPTLVLDEVDTGLGGETAARVGRTLAAMGARRQVLVVTHRAEIAACAHAHLVVERGEASTAGATVRRVDGEERVGEVARLLSGRATAAATARARELLEEGRAGDAGAAASTIAAE